MNWERKHKRSITFTGKDGRFAGKVKVGECGKRGNRHFNIRRPDGPVCECGAPWQPICPTFTCPGSKVPRQMIRSEKQDAGTKRFPGHPMFKPRPVHDTAPRRESPTKAARPTVLDGKLKALEAKYGGRHERRRAA